MIRFRTCNGKGHRACRPCDRNRRRLLKHHLSIRKISSNTYTRVCNDQGLDHWVYCLHPITFRFCPRLTIFNGHIAERFYVVAQGPAKSSGVSLHKLLALFGWLPYGIHVACPLSVRVCSKHILYFSTVCKCLCRGEFINRK